MRKFPAHGYDVFLSATGQDAEIAETALGVFENAGLRVYPFWREIPTRSRSNFIRRTLKEARAVVGVLTKDSMRDPLVQFILAASWALEKPVYVLLHGVRPDELSVPLRRFPNLPLHKIHEVVDELAGGVKGKTA